MPVRGSHGKAGEPAGRGAGGAGRPGRVKASPIGLVGRAGASCAGASSSDPSKAGRWQRRKRWGTTEERSRSVPGASSGLGDAICVRIFAGMSARRTTLDAPSPILLNSIISSAEHCGGHQ